MRAVLVWQLPAAERAHLHLERPEEPEAPLANHWAGGAVGLVLQPYERVLLEDDRPGGHVVLGEHAVAAGLINEPHARLV